MEIDQRNTEFNVSYFLFMSIIQNLCIHILNINMFMHVNTSYHVICIVRIFEHLCCQKINRVYCYFAKISVM